MIKLVCLLKRKHGTTPAEFRQYYERSHVKMALENMGHLLVEYRRNYLSNPPALTDAELGREPDDGGPDVVTEMCFRDEAGLAEFSKIFEDPKLHQMFVEDEKRFLDREASRWGVSETVESRVPV